MIPNDNIIELTTNELVDIVQTYQSADNEGVGSSTPDHDEHEKLLSKIESEIEKRGHNKKCGYCKSYLYEDKDNPTYKDKHFCFGRCKDLYVIHYVNTTH